MDQSMARERLVARLSTFFSLLALSFACLSAFEPAIIAVATAAIVLVTVIAGYLPARRATKVDQANMWLDLREEALKPQRHGTTIIPGDMEHSEMIQRAFNG
jgi:hypothetical protein